MPYVILCLVTGEYLGKRPGQVKVWPSYAEAEDAVYQDIAANKGKYVFEAYSIEPEDRKISRRSRRSKGPSR